MKLTQLFFSSLFIGVAMLQTGCTSMGADVLYSAMYAKDMFDLPVLSGTEATEVKISHPGRGASDPTVLRAIKSVITDDPFTRDHLKDSGLYRTVKLTKYPAGTPPSAAQNATNNGVDAYVMIDNGGEGWESGLSSKVIYGSLTFRVVRRDGLIVYQQTAKLHQRSNTMQTYSEREVANQLTPAIIADMQASMDGTAQADDPAKPGLIDGAMSRLNGLLPNREN